MSDRSVVVRLQAIVSGFKRDMDSAAKSVKGVGDEADRTSKRSTTAVRGLLDSAEKHQQQWTKVGRTMLVTGGLIAAGLGVAAHATLDFDQELSNVAAVSGATAEQMQVLRAAALQAGADTKYSASEAAKAEAELAKVGLSTADILGGALTGSLSLAAAGNVDLADAATYAGQSMKIFGLAGKDVGHIADVLAAGANKSATDVGQLAQALQQGGLVAAQTGLSLEDTVGTLSAFADNTLIGSDAGTSFKTMLQRLNPQSDQAARLMDKLGLRAYDSQGQFIGLANYAGKLRTALGSMSAEQRNAALQTLFGSDAVRAANVLYRIGADGVREYTDAVNDQGAAQRTAAIQMDNLAGDLEELRGSIETNLIQVGSGANDTLRALAQGATFLTNMVGNIPEPVLKVGTALAAVTAAALITGGALTTLTVKAAAARTTLVQLGLASEATAARLTRVAKSAAAVGAAAAAISVAGAGLDQALGVHNQSLDEAGKSLLAYAKSGRDAEGVTGQMSRGFKNLDDALRLALDESKWGKVKEFFSDLGTLTIVPTSKDDYVSFLKNVDAGLANLVQSGHLSEAESVFSQLTEAARNQGHSVSDVASRLPQYAEALKTTGTQASDAVDPTQALAGMVNGVAVTADTASDAIDKYVQSLADAGLVQLSARDAARNYEQALDDAAKAIKENGRSLDIHTEAGRKNQEALDNVAKTAIAQAQAIYESTKATEGELPAQEAYRASLLKSRDGLVATAIKFGLSRKEAEKFADQLLQIPAKVEPEVGVKGVEKAIIDAQRLRDALLGIKDRQVTVDVAVNTANKLAAQGARLLTPASGGYIQGPGSGTSDSIPAMVSNGEYVVKAAAVSKYGVGFFHRLNAMRYASGGAVGETKSSAPAFAARQITFTGDLVAPNVDQLARKVEQRMRQADALYPLYR